jgi:NADPH-dependent ferric siderophore reductase
VRLAARTAKVDAVGRTAALLREGGAERSALAGDDTAAPAGEELPR